MNGEGCVVTIPTYVSKQEDGSTFTAYQVVIAFKGHEWKTSVRYSTFRLLHDAVKRRFPSARLPKLPPKKLVGNASEEFLDKRRVELANYLQELLSVPAIRSSEEVFRILELSSPIGSGSAETTESNLASEQASRRGVVTHDFDGDSSQNLLSLKPDEVITILRENDPHGLGWWWGEKSDGSQGYFPSSYIRFEQGDNPPLQQRKHTEIVALRLQSPSFAQDRQPGQKKPPPPLPVRGGSAILLPTACVQNRNGRKEGEAAPNLKSSQRQNSPVLAQRSQQPTPQRKLSSGSQAAPITINRPVVPPRTAAGAPATGLALPDSGSKDRRTRIATEILSTERTYMDGLKWLTEEYKPALLKLHEEVVNETTIKKIFSNLEIILNLNKTLLSELETRMKTWDSEKTSIGDLFKGLAPYLKMYKDYGNNFESASETCQQIRENPTVNACLETVKGKCQSLTIEALLITPIQRLPRYNLLIEDLLRNTPETHPDYSNLVEALKSTKEVADYINDSIRQAEQSAKFRNLASQGEQFRILLEAHRTLVMEGKVTLAERKTKSQWMICLFNDIFVPAKSQKAEVTPQLKVPLTLTWLNPDGPDLKEPAFEIITPERRFVFVVATPQERQNWVKAIGDGIQNNIQNKSDCDLLKRQGFYAYSTGGEFNGQWLSGKRHGSGRLEYFNGNVYDGEWMEDMRHGRGTLTYFSGEVYTGEWLNDKKHGQGTMTYSNGATYVGQWEEGLRSGSGTITFKNGDVFEGKFNSDRASGKGKLRYRVGFTYEGFFEDDRKHGLGMLRSDDGKQEYQGSWVNGRKDGVGTMNYADGSVYQGNWHEDKKHGTGKLTEVDGAEYNGEWVKDLREGKGTQHYSNGDVYEGLWKDDKRNGHGILLSKEGHKYEGEWSNGRRQGKGTMTFIHGEKYEGLWLNDRAHGTGLWMTTDGTKFEGKWTHGQRDGKCSISQPGKPKDAAFQGICKDNIVTGTSEKVFELAPLLLDLNVL